MVSIEKESSDLMLIYTPESDGMWIQRKLVDDGSVTIRKCFTFRSSDLIDSPSAHGDIDYIFQLGKRKEQYFIIEKEILGIKFDLFLFKDMNITLKTFIATRDISIFNRIDKLIEEQIIIGGDMKGAIPLSEFETLIKIFPTTATINHYANSMISGILRDYFDTMSDVQLVYENNLKRLGSVKKKIQFETSNMSNIIFKPLQKYELEKYQYLYAAMKKMLLNINEYTENDWQKKILEILLLLFPKYEYVLEKLKIPDKYTERRMIKREIDIVLIDFEGNLDIIEIKKPNTSRIISKNTYRDNYIPNRELSGAIMQVEKYIYYLQKWGSSGEKEIYEKYKTLLPKCTEINITNPKALIIAGRSNDFSINEKTDLEIIRRKHTNIIDIITYDDLLVRLNGLIAKFGED